jgi:hypothetical protein
VVANGKVYVGSYRALTIFGPNGSPAAASASVPIAVSAALPPGITRRISGQLLSLTGTDLTLLTRTSQTVQIDDAVAVANRRVSMLTVGHAYTVLGNFSSGSSVIVASAVSRAKSSSATWPEDQ